MKTGRKHPSTSQGDTSPADTWISDSQPPGLWEINVCCVSQQSVAFRYYHFSWLAHGVIPPWRWCGKPFLLWISVIVKEQKVKQEIRRTWDVAIYSPGENIQENLPAPPGMSVTRSFLCLKSLRDSSHCWGSRPTPDPGSPGCGVSLPLSPDLPSWLLHPNCAHLLSPLTPWSLCLGWSEAAAGSPTLSA